MGTDVREIEWQFDALDLRPVLRWLEARAGNGDAAQVRTVATRSVSNVDLYLDTDDRRFQRAGYSLRIRRAGRGTSAGGEATLKCLENDGGAGDGLRTRREISQRLDQGEPETLPVAEGPVGERVRAVAGGKPLLLLFEVRTRRRRFAVESDGAQAGEVALDETSIRPVDGGAPARLRRVEVEVPGPLKEAVEPFVSELREACGLQPALLSKFEAGLLSSGLGPPAVETFGPIEVGPDSEIGDVALAVLRRQFAALRAKEPGTRLGDDIEELHDMRVASRRLRAALSLFADVLPSDVLGQGDELRWVGGVLGEVRDLDVQLEQLDGWLEELPDEDREPLLVLRGLLESQRADARRAMLEALDSRRYEVFAARFGRALRPRRARRPGRFAQPAVVVAPDMIERRFRSVRKGGRAIGPGSPARDYHRLRIRCKRLRYALEFLGSVYPGETRALVRRLVALQDLLGLHQDAAVAIDRLRALAAGRGGDLPPATVFAMGEVAGRYRQSMMELEVGFPKRFARVTGKTWRDLRRVLEAGRPAEEQPGPQHEPDGDPLGSSDEPPPRSTARWPGLSGELEA